MQWIGVTVLSLPVIASILIWHRDRHLDTIALFVGASLLFSSSLASSVYSELKYAHLNSDTPDHILTEDKSVQWIASLSGILLPYGIFIFAGSFFAYGLRKYRQSGTENDV